MALNIDAKFKGKLTCTFKNDMRNLGNFNQSTLKCPNWDFDWIIQSRKCMSLKLTRFKISWKWCKIGGGIDLSFQNWNKKFDKLWSEHTKISKSCTLLGSFWSKYIMFELKKYRRVIFDGTEDWCKIWRKTDLCFLKWHEEFAKFSFTSWKIAILFKKLKWWK